MLSSQKSYNPAVSFYKLNIIENTEMSHKPCTLSMRSVVFGIIVILTAFTNASLAEQDNREPIALDDAGRAFIVHEMQQYVSGLQQALTALSKDDLKGVATAVRPLGMQGMTNAPRTLMSAVPDGFRQIGMPIHMAFDKIADSAEKGATKNEILSMLGMAMSRCVACHATYRIEPK